MKDNNLPIRNGVYLALLNNDKEILLTKSKSRNRYIYNLPGGAIEDGEGTTDALKREVYEEIGLIISLDDNPIYITKDLHINPDYPENFMQNSYYKISNMDLNLESIKCSGEVIECKWFKLDEVPSNQMLSVDIEFIKYLQQNMK